MLRQIDELVVDAVSRRSKRVVLLLAIFLLLAAVEFAIGAITTRLGLLQHGLIDATIHGGLAILAAWLLLEAARERRARIRAQMQEAAQLNHEIRNALEVIGQAGYLLDDVVYGRAVTESIERIRKTLDQHGDTAA